MNETEDSEELEEPDFMSNEARTHVSVMVTGQTEAGLLSVFLITNSMEFQLDPWPNDKWNFVFKNESLRDNQVSHFLEVIHAKYAMSYCDGWNEP